VLYNVEASVLNGQDRHDMLVSLLMYCEFRRTSTRLLIRAKGM
jgi:hypothetical protein